MPSATKLRRLCFYTCLSVILFKGGMSNPTPRGEVQGLRRGGGCLGPQPGEMLRGLDRGVSRPLPRGEVEGSGQRGVSGQRGCLARGGCLPMGCLARRGVCPPGVCPGGVWPGGVSGQEGLSALRVSAQGVSAKRGCRPRGGICPEGVSAQGGLSGQAPPIRMATAADGMHPTGRHSCY